MENIFNVFSDDSRKVFTWESLDDVEHSRNSLGVEIPAKVYRLMQFSLLDIISSDLGKTKANYYFQKAGHLAGTEIAGNMLDLNQDFNSFISHLQESLKLLKIGILRMEFFNPENGEIILTVAEDLDCSGVPITNESVCSYGEGFLSGILEAYTGKEYIVRETDCWATGDRVCRFRAAPAYKGG
jgi:predicted hydrocarbon binding protein